MCNLRYYARAKEKISLYLCCHFGRCSIASNTLWNVSDCVRKQVNAVLQISWFVISIHKNSERRGEKEERVVNPSGYAVAALFYSVGYAVAGTQHHVFVYVRVRVSRLFAGNQMYRHRAALLTPLCSIGQMTVFLLI